MAPHFFSSRYFCPLAISIPIKTRCKKHTFLTTTNYQNVQKWPTIQKHNWVGQFKNVPVQSANRLFFSNKQPAYNSLNNDVTSCIRNGLVLMIMRSVHLEVGIKPGRHLALILWSSLLRWCHSGVVHGLEMWRGCSGHIHVVHWSVVRSVLWSDFQSLHGIYGKRAIKTCWVPTTLRGSGGQRS